MCFLIILPYCLRHIASKLAFMPPPRSYGLNCVIDELPKKRKTQHHKNGDASMQFERNFTHRYKLILNDYAPWQFSDEEEKYFEAFYARSRRGKDIACLYVKCSPTAKYTILFSHPNAVDLGLMSGYLLGLGQEINCNVFGYDYSGYGCSSGKPNEKNIYADIDAAWKALKERYNVRPENVILYGQSIGSVPTIDLASRSAVAAVILHSAFMSAIRLLLPWKRCTVYDSFPNIEKVPKISAPVLVIHGTNDDIVKFRHGEAIFKKCRFPVRPLWVEGAGHNDVERYYQFIQRLKSFVSVELDAYQKYGPLQQKGTPEETRA